MRHEYGDSKRGDCYEYVNFFGSLQAAGYEIRLFDYMQAEHELGRVQMNELLCHQAEEWQPDLALVSLYTDQIFPETVQALREVTTTLCFFHDDTWRRDFVNEWAPRFDWFTSSDFECKHKYTSRGLDHVIHFPFGANENLYFPRHLPKKYPVSFVGQWHPHRAWLIKKLKQAGIDVHVRGHGWPGGIVTLSEMTEIFSQSHINLNLSNCTSWDARYLLHSWRAIKDTLRSKKIYEQIKGRHFEIPACGGCQLSYYVDGIENCYLSGKEILLYSGVDDLVDKTRYYLTQPNLCASIGEASLKRTLSEHTYKQRFQWAFEKIGLCE